MPQTEILGRLGTLTTRLAQTMADVDAAQALRFEIFHRENGAQLNTQSMTAERDHDPFDSKCLHLLVECDGEIVGTTRLLIARADGPAEQFYSATEFDLSPFLKAHGSTNIMELGRSCIAAEHRSRRAMELLWHGVWTIALRHNATTMFGCASLPGTAPAENETALTYLQTCATAGAMPRPLAGSARPELPQTPAHTSERRAFAALPALMKGYLRLGARIAPGAVIDHDFGTTDFFVSVEVARINPRYLAHYGEQATRYAA
jgi:putative hemolysin